MSKQRKEYLLYAVIFGIGYWAACNSGGNAVTGTSGSTTTSGIRRMLSSDLRPVALVQRGSDSQSFASASFLNVRPQTTTNPSPVGQSYESDCRNFGPPNGPFTPLHAAWGNSGLVSLNYTYGTFGACLQPQLITSVGGDENGVPQGYPIVDDGSVNTLVVYGTFVSGNRFRCVDTTNTSALSDGSFVRAYYDLTHDAIILGSGTTQLAPTCSISIPAGDDVVEIHVQWLKS